VPYNVRRVNKRQRGAPANNTTAAEYTFTPDAGQYAIIAKLTVILNAKTTPTFAAVGPICSGGSFTLPTTSLNGIPGKWSPAISNTATTQYTFTPADGQCATTATLTVTVNPLPTVGAGADVSICNGGSTTLTATGASS
jgi:hypothetical protein